MTVGLVFGGFWAGLGVLMWWWPAAVFVSFSTEDVTPGARGFAVGSIFIGMALLTLESARVGLVVSAPATVFVVGVLLLAHPVPIAGVHADGPVTPRRAGAALAVGGALSALLVATGHV